MTVKSKGIFLVVAALLVVGVAGYAAMHFLMTAPDDLDLSRSKASAEGIYLVSIEPDPADFNRNDLHSWVVGVKTAEGAAVEGAEISVDGGMPQHGHGLPTSPQVTSHLGEGRYRVEGVRFNMDGWWEFKFEISSPAGTDQVVFNLSL